MMPIITKTMMIPKQPKHPLLVPAFGLVGAEGWGDADFGDSIFELDSGLFADASDCWIIVFSSCVSSFSVFVYSSGEISPRARRKSSAAFASSVISSVDGNGLQTFSSRLC